MSDLRPLSSSISKLTTQTFARKFMALGRILSEWDNIVGPELAAKCQPAKIHYRKPKNKGDKPDATLDIAASSADAAVLHYQKGLIIAKLNQIFGDNWISAIRFVHIASNTGTKNYNSVKMELSQDEKSRISGVVEHIEDDDLRKRLEKLGQSVLRKVRQHQNDTHDITNTRP